MERIFPLYTSPTRTADKEKTMRSEKTLYDLILSFARHNDAIRAVRMNGSRANPNAPKDILQDFDIVYAVTDIGPFRKNPGWIQIRRHRVLHVRWGRKSCAGPH